MRIQSERHGAENGSSAPLTLFNQAEIPELDSSNSGMAMMENPLFLVHTGFFEGHQRPDGAFLSDDKEGAALDLSRHI